ncbi:MAG: hypothetical protein A2538_00800 [Candidatus Magasanikbacteria bacterium RIFOXYD2_FULL_41_14]|uniref:Uncharacterized protein n=1 Tax=Candidatus Magasanikbacteria bacterium RIFOXYD2_FULL_41_14 TaxID=1798709 RepID=A0A1F6PDU6_9BACT|nr:MAG: hypothetical protein A2538_00800 [Candidatus Magasanikbacteria bacterium RIFOXYD2_FULL_41_14]
MQDNFIHADQAAGKWQTLTLCEQLGNVGSEVGRAAKWEVKGMREMRDKALERGFELLDLTIADIRWHGPKLKEICRAREVLADTFYGDREYGDTPEKMEKYFFEFALSARNKIS